MTNDLCWMRGKGRGKALTILEELIYSHAMWVDCDNAALREWSNLQGNREGLAKFTTMLWHEALREVRKERRKIRREPAVKVRMVNRQILNLLLAGVIDRGKGRWR